jgi:glutathione S-transferase
MIRLYDYLPSGNGYKVRLLLSQLQISFERIELDIIKGNTRTPGFLRKFPNGRIPAVEFDDGRRLFESNAIIWHFAETTSLVPQNPFERARVLQWMFFEQYSHEPYIAVARFFAMHPDHPDERRGGLPRIIRGGYDALGVMESHLGGSGEGDHHASSWSRANTPSRTSRCTPIRTWRTKVASTWETTRRFGNGSRG